MLIWGSGRNVSGVLSNKERKRQTWMPEERASEDLGKGPGRAAARWTWTGFVVISAMVELRH